jgi:NhaP-type Na+/H+ or K+/H+ antiporter
MQKLLIILFFVDKTLQAGGQIDPIEDFLFYVIISVLIGLVCLLIKYYTSIPYTPMLLLIGLLIGLFGKNLGILGSSTKYIIGLSSHALLFVFIPPLIFESSFNSDFFVFVKSLWQILILAFPVVALICVFIAVIMLYILDYQNILGWGESLTIGAIISATDPVAVVALLKELGTPVKFNVILEGESLLNDGTATVFFWVFMDMVAKGKFDIGSFFITFVRLSIGGPLIGLAIGIITYPIMKRLIHTPTVFVIMSIIICYSTFFISESDNFKIKVSGILALVTVGLYLGSKLKYRLIGTLEETMHVIWHFLAYILETILFLITGAYLGDFFVSDKLTKYLNANDIWKIIVFQVLLVLVRGICLVISWPILNLVGTTKMNWKDILVMTYAGLRGAIGLSLALFIATSDLKDTDEYEHFKIITIFYTAITIAFTVLFKGLTIKFIMNGIKFVENNILYEKMKIIVKEKFVIKSIDKLESLKKMKTLSEANWEKVEEILKFSENMKFITKNMMLLNEEDNFHKLDKLIESLEAIIEMKEREIQNKNFDSSKRERKKSLGLARMNSISKFDIGQEKLNDVFPKDKEQAFFISDSVITESNVGTIGRIDKTSVYQNQIIENDEMKKTTLLVDNEMKKPTLLINIQEPKLIGSKIPYKTSIQELIKEDKVINIENKNLNSTIIFNEASPSIESRRPSLFNPYFKVNNFAIMEEVRFRLYKMIVAGVLEKYENNLCLYSTFKFTKKIGQILEEDLKQPISLYKEIQKHSLSRLWITVFIKCKKLPLIGKFFRNKLYDELFKLYDLYWTLMIVLEEILHLSDFNIVFQIIKYNKYIIKEIDKEIENFQEGINQSFYNLSMRAVQTRKAVNIMINFQLKLVNFFYTKGELSDKEYNAINEEIESALKFSKELEFAADERTVNKMIERKLRFLFSLFIYLSDEDMDHLETLITEKKTNEGDVLFELNKEPTHVYLCENGLVTVRITRNFNIKRHGKGEIVGLENVYSEKNLTEAKMESDGYIYLVPIDFFRTLADKYFEIELDCKRESSFFLIKDINPEMLETKSVLFNQLRSFKSLYLNSILKKSVPCKLLKDSKRNIPKNPIYLLTGILHCKFTKSQKENTFKENDAITMGAKVLTALTDCFFLELLIDDFII